MVGFKPGTVLEFLQYCDLSRHVTLLDGQGYRSIVDIFLLTEHDLDYVHIMTKNERLAILSAGKFASYTTSIILTFIALINSVLTLRFDRCCQQCSPKQLFSNQPTVSR